MLPFLVVVLALIGFWIALYFTGVYYKWFSPHVFWVPRVCQLDEKSCLTVLETPRAKLFGIPNSAFGMVVYGYLIFDSLFFLPTIIALMLLTAAVLRSIYLAYSLLFITKIPCPLCFTTHGINLILFIVYVFRLVTVF